MKIDIEDYVLNIISKQKDTSNALRLRKEWLNYYMKRLLKNKTLRYQ